MSVHTEAELKSGKGPPFDHKPTKCFFCGEALFESKKHSTGAFVHWHGQTPLDLHQICAETLGVHLIQDARSAASITKKRCKSIRTKISDVSEHWYAKKKAS